MSAQNDSLEKAIKDLTAAVRKQTDDAAKRASAAEQKADDRLAEDNRKSALERAFDKATKFDDKELEATTKKLREKYQELVNIKKQEAEKVEKLKEEYLDINTTEERRKEIEEEVVKLERQSQEELRKTQKEYDWLLKKFKEGVTLNERINHSLEKMGVNTRKVQNGANEISQSFNKIKGYISEDKKAWVEADQAAATYSKTIGGSVSNYKELRRASIDFLRNNQLAYKYNASVKELLDLQTKYVHNIGRAKDLTNEQKEALLQMRSIYGEEFSANFAGKLENFGIDSEEAAKRAGQMYASAARKGIDLQKYSGNFLENIQMAQNYTFEKGLKSVQSMAEKSAALKLNMQQATQFADKVSTLEGAMQAGAKLSVLGGSFAGYGNPLSMMYEGLNSPDKLYDRIVNMFGDLGRWDKEKGQVDVSAFNRQRIKAAAEATGLDYSNVMEMINAKGAQNEIGQQIRGLGYTKDEAELIRNTAHLDEKGNAFVSINGQKKYLKDGHLGADDMKALNVQHSSDSDKLGEIVTLLQGAVDKEEGFDKQLANSMANIWEKLGIGEMYKSGLDFLSKTTDYVAGAKMLLHGIMSLVAMIAMVNGAGNIGGGVLNMFRGKGARGTASGKTATPAPSGNVGAAPAATPSPAAPAGTVYKMSNKGKIWTSTDGGKTFRLDGKGHPIKANALKGPIVNANGTPITNAPVGAGAGTGAAGTAKGSWLKANGLGVGSAVAAVGASVGGAYWNNKADQIDDKSSNRYRNNKIGAGALQGAGMGASLLMGFGLPGMAIGAIGGALIGGFMGANSAKQAREAQEIDNLRNRIYSERGFYVRGNYSIEEMQQIYNGKDYLGPSLKGKMSEQGDDWTQMAYKTGTSYVSQRAGDRMRIRAGLQPYGTHAALLHTGEMVIPSGKNPLNAMKVSSNEAINRMNNTHTFKFEVPKSSVDLNLNFGNGMTEKIKDAVRTDLMKDKNFKDSVVSWATRHLTTMNNYGVDRKESKALYPFSKRV